MFNYIKLDKFLLTLLMVVLGIQLLGLLTFKINFDASLYALLYLMLSIFMFFLGTRVNIKFTSNHTLTRSRLESSYMINLIARRLIILGFLGLSYYLYRQISAGVNISLSLSNVADNRLGSIYNFDITNILNFILVPFIIALCGFVVRFYSVLRRLYKVCGVLLILLYGILSIISGGSMTLFSLFAYGFLMLISYKKIRLFRPRYVLGFILLLLVSIIIFYARVIAIYGDADFYYSAHFSGKSLRILSISSPSGVLSYVFFGYIYLLDYFSQSIINLLYVITNYSSSLGFYYGEIQSGLFYKLFALLAGYERPVIETMLSGKYRTALANAYFDFSWFALVEFFMLGVVLRVIYRKYREQNILGIMLFPYTLMLMIFGIFADNFFTSNLIYTLFPILVIHFWVVRGRCF